MEATVIIISYRYVFPIRTPWIYLNNEPEFRHVHVDIESIATLQFPEYRHVRANSKRLTRGGPLIAVLSSTFVGEKHETKTPYALLVNSNFRTNITCFRVCHFHEYENIFRRP